MNHAKLNLVGGNVDQILAEIEALVSSEEFPECVPIDIVDDPAKIDSVSGSDAYQSYTQACIRNLALSVHNREQIIAFVSLREEFGSAFLLGDYESARGVLDTIFRSSGYSTYYLEKLLILEFHQNGFRSAQDLVRRVLSEISDDTIKFVVRAAWNRVRINGSIHEYQRMLEHELSDEVDESGRELLRFIVYPDYAEFDYDLHGRIVSEVASISIVDRYLLTLKSLRCAVASERLTASEGVRIADALVSASKKISDSHLKVLKCAYQNSTENDAPPLPWISGELLEVYNLYYTGEFSKAESLLKLELERNPLSISIASLLAKSHIHSSSKDPIQIGAAYSPATKIVECLVDLYSEDVDSSVAARKLDALGSSLGECLLGLALSQLSDIHTGNVVPVSNRKMVSLYQREIDPFFFEAYTREFKRKVLVQLKQRYGEMPFISIVSANYGLVRRDGDIQATLHPVIKAIYRCRAWKDAGDYKKILQFFESNVWVRPEKLLDLRWSRHLLELEVGAMVSLNRPLDLLMPKLLFGVGRFESFRRFVIREELVEALKIDWPEALERADFSLLCCILTNNEFKRARIIRKLLEVSRAKSAEEYIANADEDEQECVWRIFGEIYNHSLILKSNVRGEGDRSVREVVCDKRTDICLCLYERFEGKRDIIIGELLWLLRSRRVERISRLMERSKFRMDVDEMIADCKARLQRELRIVVDSRPGGEREDDIVCENTVSYVIQDCLKEYIHHSDEKSHLGLEKILSRRIRHGFITNKLRKPLEKTGIVLLRTGDVDEYVDPDLFKLLNKGILEHDDNKVFIGKCRELSAAVDSVLEEFSEQYVRIRLPSNLSTGCAAEMAFFDYGDFIESAESRVRETIEKGAGSEDLLIEEVFSLLVEYTEDGLVRAQKYIRNVLGAQLSSKFQSFQLEVEGMNFGRGDLERIKSRVARGRDAVEAAIRVVEVWFSEPQPFEEPNVLFGDVFEAAFKVVGIARNGIRICVNENLEHLKVDDEKMAISLHDIFSISLENAERHSTKISGIELNGTVSEGLVECLISIKDDCMEVEKLDESIEMAKAKIESGERALSRGQVREGGTGFLKVVALLKSFGQESTVDVFRDNNCFVTKLVFPV